MYGMHTNEELEKFVNMYISCDVSLLPNNKIKNIPKKIMIICDMFVKTRCP